MLDALIIYSDCERTIYDEAGNGDVSLQKIRCGGICNLYYLGAASRRNNIENGATHSSPNHLKDSEGQLVSRMQIERRRVGGHEEAREFSSNRNIVTCPSFEGRYGGNNRCRI